ncbi:MAG: hypothetical protein E6G35_03000 [Actinobacteria bacterium]|nr:MAG: hypothetical protein E6G35_03000 [Actinomycetota bacterium]
MNGMPKVQVVPERVTVRPGEGTEVEVGTVTVNLRVPERPAPDAGLYTLGILVRSPYQKRVSRCEELRLDVQPAPGVSIEAQPEAATGGGTATYALRLTNQGNTPLDVSLQGSDPEGVVGFFFRPRSVRVAPNATAPAELTVRAAAPWSGQELRRTLTVRAAAGTDLSSEKLVTFTQRPRIPGGPLRFVGIALAVGVLATATLAGALMRNVADSKPGAAQSQPAATGVAAGPPLQIVTSAPPSAPASSAPPAGSPSAGKSAGTPAPGTATVLDPSQPPDGQPPQDRPISGDLWAAQGVKLSLNLEHATTGCTTGTSVALRATKTYGIFLVGKGAPYQLLIQQADGTIRALPPATPPAMTEATFDYDAPPGAPLIAIQFGHASTDPNSNDPTIIKRVVFS